MSQMIEHIVLFKVKDDVDSDKIDAMVDGLNSLATIDQVLYISAAPIHRLRSASAFTHVLHSRYRSKEDLSAYVAHPDHLRVVEATMPIWEDIMSVDWIAHQAPGILKPPAGSVGKVTLLKVKENVTEEAKKEIMEVVKEKSHEITVGENFSPARAKGFSIASVAYFKDLGEVEVNEELVKEKIGGYVEDTIVVEFMVPTS
ncbi:dimeric A/B barrel domainS-protein 1 [Raphanus sativus]|uniref:Stress-response A/B barrel domain-containing protein DABB1 n=1 Tax=Raphanus sativus TaxID=3726 RepID=A0A6J0KM29_RAPSA|nr:stress-response A/B barrel domain-containing protein DABB1 [Raphanus sativus]KAJ4882183.1 dimeric A/B barrel domainS-protein 1 [Raphanus sativus]